MQNFLLACPQVIPAVARRSSFANEGEQKLRRALNECIYIMPIPFRLFIYLLAYTKPPRFSRIDIRGLRQILGQKRFLALLVF